MHLVRAKETALILQWFLQWSLRICSGFSAAGCGTRRKSILLHQQLARLCGSSVCPAPDLGSSARKGVGVQVSPSAPII